MRSQKGLTLIEILVSFTILSILAGLLFGVVGPSKEQARQKTCAAQLQQIYAGIVMYADENNSYVENGLVPFVPVGLKAHLMPYVKNDAVFRCPDTPADTAYSLDMTYADAMIGHKWQPEVDREQNRFAENVQKLGSGAWLLYCNVHDEVVYQPAEVDINQKYIKPFVIDLFLDGSVKAHRSTDERLRAKFITK